MSYIIYSIRTIYNSYQSFIHLIHPLKKEMRFRE